MLGQVRELFRAAIENAPCIVFMDEVDVITPKRETSSRGMEKRIVAQVGVTRDQDKKRNKKRQLRTKIKTILSSPSLSPYMDTAKREKYEKYSMQVIMEMSL